MNTFQSSAAVDPWRARFRTATPMWATALLIGSLQPMRPGGIHLGFIHHLAHFLCFGTLAFLATAGFGNPTRTSILPAVQSFLFGLAIELLQHWQDRMPVEWYDVRDDAVGIIVLTVLFHTFYRRYAATKSSVIIIK